MYQILVEAAVIVLVAFGHASLLERAGQIGFSPLGGDAKKRIAWSVQQPGADVHRGEL